MAQNLIPLRGDLPTKGYVCGIGVLLHTYTHIDSKSHRPDENGCGNGALNQNNHDAPDGQRLTPAHSRSNAIWARITALTAGPTSPSGPPAGQSATGALPWPHRDTPTLLLQETKASFHTNTSLH
jgi:hypothetical protein